MGSAAARGGARRWSLARRHEGDDPEKHDDDDHQRDIWFRTPDAELWRKRSGALEAISGRRYVDRIQRKFLTMYRAVVLSFSFEPLLCRRRTAIDLRRAHDHAVE